MKLSLKNMTIVALLGGFTAAGVAFADSHSADSDGSKERMPRAERMFQQMDTDGDGKISAEDATAFAAKRFANRDIDGDGVISREDRKQFRTKRREERRAMRFAKIDRDSDGMISLEEFTQAKPDRNRRGMRGNSDRAERGERQHRGEGKGRKNRREAHGSRGHRGHGMRHGGRRGGVLTIQEAEARALQRFERMDSDNDGIVTLDEVKASKPRRGHRNK